MQANIAVANAYVADITPAADRARRFGLLGAMMGLGFILGPALGGILGDLDLRLPFVASGSLAVVNWIYGYFVLPESLPGDRRTPFAWRKANPVSALRGLVDLRGVGPLIAVIALSTLSQFMLHSTWVLYTTFKFGWGPTENGWSMFAVGLAAALVQGVLLGRLLKRFEAKKLAIIGLVSSTLGYLAWGLAPAGWVMYLIIALNLLGFTVTAAMQSIVSNAADASSQGQTMGSVASLTSLMAVVGPVLGAPLMGAVSHLQPGDWRIGAPFYFCAAVQLLSLLVATRHFRRERQLASLSAAQSPAV